MENNALKTFALSSIAFTAAMRLQMSLPVAIANFLIISKDTDRMPRDLDSFLVTLKS